MATITNPIGFTTIQILAGVKLDGLLFYTFVWF